MKLSKIVKTIVGLSLITSVVACGEQNQPGPDNPGTNPENPPVVEDKTPLVVGYSPFSNKFSPFFSETAYDQDAYAMTQVSLLESDRTGAIIYKGIEGETISYNGSDYTYKGIADLTVTENTDGTVYYDFKIRDDVKFSDGHTLDIDDVIFSMYVLSDPTYDGASSFFALPVQGMSEYRQGMAILYNMLIEAGEDNTDFTYWTEAEQNEFWTVAIPEAGAAFAQSIVDYVLANYVNDYYSMVGAASPDEVLADTTLQVKLGEMLWGFSGEGETAADYWAEIYEAYGGDIVTASATEAASSEIYSYIDGKWAKGVKTGESAANISGIQRKSSTELRVILTEVDATAIYNLGVAVAPLHYYGEESLYDYANNKFGFVKGDLSHVKSVTTKPMGAGPYKFIKFENGVISYEANPYYFKGAPATKYLNFLECIADTDKVNGVTTGTVDITDPSLSATTIGAIESANSNKQLTGDKVVTSLVDNLGYGYIGINAENVKVGDDQGSEASKSLRKALATVLAVYRDVAIDSYYGDRAAVINYPISNTSWAAPQPTDEGYEIAFSKDASGKSIFTASMTADEKYAAALQASLSFFKAAGYTVKDGKVIDDGGTGAGMEWEIWIPADGTGDHPAFMILTEAQKAFESIGINFKIKDLANSADLWEALDAQQLDMWAAAWGATVDPDMYQIYYSGSQPENPTAGGSNYQYAIHSEELDKLILAGRKSTDQNYRKAIYKEALSLVVDYAVEIPTYQRKNCIIFSNERVNMNTVTPDITTFYGWMGEIEKTKLAK